MKFFRNMFEAWFKPKFLSKCKSNIELTLMRIEMIKRRRNAMQKYLRSDIAQLIKIDHDFDAYGRVGRLYLHQLRSLCYDFVEKFCSLVLNHLETMNYESECPEECKEAVSSLIYAAARFADLPELRKLRSLFSEKYGNSLESFVNKEFISLLKPDQPTKDMKVQLMREIVVEYGVEWDSNSLERKLDNPPSSKLDSFENAYDDQDKEPRITGHENSWMINIQETTTDNNNDHKKDDLNAEIEKQTQNMRQRLLDYWSRTTSLLSTSRDTSTSSEESSSDDSNKSKSFFSLRLMSPPYVKKDRNKNGTNSNTFNSDANKQKDDGDKENENVLNHPKDEATPPTTSVRNRWRKNGGVRATQEPKGHVHPKIPDYDDIVAQFATLRAKNQ